MPHHSNSPAKFTTGYLQQGRIGRAAGSSGSKNRISRDMAERRVTSDDGSVKGGLGEGKRGRGDREFQEKGAIPDGNVYPYLPLMISR